MADATTRLRLRVAPGAPRNGIVGRHGEAWKVRVRGAPERGRANADVLSLLAEALQLPERSLTLVSGHASRDKVVELHGLDPEEAERRLDRAR
jgi:uncharacterized protein